PAFRRNLLELSEGGSRGLAIARNWNGFAAAHVLAIIYRDNDNARFRAGTASRSKRLVQRPALLGDFEFKVVRTHSAMAEPSRVNVTSTQAHGGNLRESLRSSRVNFEGNK